MEKFYLEQPSMDRKDEIIEYLNEFIEYRSDINGTGSLDKIFEGYTFEQALDRCLNMANKEYAETVGRCQSKTFLLIRQNDNKIVGTINVRWNLNEAMLRFGGHIGYGIRPTERRKGYNKINLYLGMIEARKIGLEKVMLDCDVNNLGSDRTLKALGGTLERTEIDPSDGVLTNVYWFNVEETINNYKDVYEQQIHINEKDIPDLNIFMMCEELNINALSSIPKGYHIRTCKPKELKIWLGFPFDKEEDKKNNYEYMNSYFNNVYGSNLEEFYNKCLFVCEDVTDKPIATCFVWKAYNTINTIHWFKTLKEYEGKGLGRALLSYIMNTLKEEDYPIFLHTQPSSFRAIGLYSDFGFKIVTNPTIGYRKNEYEASLPILKQFMKTESYEKLGFIEAPNIFDESAKTTKISQF